MSDLRAQTDPDRSRLRWLGLAALSGASALGGVTVLTGSGCTVLTNDAPPDDAGVFEGGDVAIAIDAEALGSTCRTCLAAACSAPWSACLTTSCVACPTECSCDAADGAAPPVTVYRAFAACAAARVARCATACGQDEVLPSAPPPCDDASPSDGDAGVDACTTCASAKCPGSAACATGTECATFLACASTCATTACADACAAAHATGKEAALELASCTRASCPDECGLLNR